MRKLFTLLFIAVFAVTSFGQKPTAEIQKADVPPKVDGEIDDMWEGITANAIDLNFSTEQPTLGASGETTWQAVWVPFDGIYLLVTVADDEWLTVYESGAGATYEYDKPEIYFDCNQANLEDGLGASGGPANGHHQIADWADDDSYINGGGPFESPDDPGILFSFKVENDANYVVEYYVPFEYLVDENGLMADISSPIGFDVTIIDRDTGDPARKRAVWANTGGKSESWNNMDDCGTITFEGAEPPTYIDEINATGGEITENNGSFKVPYSLVPEDANESIKWSILNDAAGRAPIATINGLGVVTARQNGTVTVAMASATDVAFDTVEVVITNQVVSMGDINLIRNGYFDDVKEDLSPAQWGGSDGEVPPYVVDGFVTLNPNPVAVGDAPWTFVFSQSQFGCNSTDSYTFSFDAWAADNRNCMVDFEDPNNAYNRYGVTESPLALPPDTEWMDDPENPWTGNSMWSFDVTTEPTSFVFDVVFRDKVANTAESLQFMFGLSDTVVYLDNIELINDLDLALIDDYTAVTEINVSAADGATVVPSGGTLQMSAEVLPAEADYKNVIWSVEPGTGYATIDAAGLLTGDTVGTVTVVAKATDDSKVMGTYNLSVSFPEGVDQHQVNILKVYPNPAVSELNVVLTRENTIVTIYSSVGMKMEEVTVSGTEHSFDISAYAPGIYFVKTDRSIAKFVK